MTALIWQAKYVAIYCKQKQSDNQYIEAVSTNANVTFPWNFSV